jgi:hypothetical protein
MRPLFVEGVGRRGLVRLGTVSGCGWEFPVFELGSCTRFFPYINGGGARIRMSNPSALYARPEMDGGGIRAPR